MNLISILIFLGSTISAAVVLFKNRDKFTHRPNATQPPVLNIKLFAKAIVIFFVGLIVAMYHPLAIERVDASGVGFKVHLTGSDRGVSKYEYKTGWVVYNTWTDQFKEIATNQQHIEYDTIDVVTKGGFMTKIKPSFNYNVIGANAGDMFVTLRKDLPEIEQTWLKNAIYSSVNDVANRWAVDSIFNHREQFEASIILECNKRVSQWFVVSQLRSNIIPPPALQESINAKTNSIQKVQVAENQKREEEAKGEKNLAIAKYEALTLIQKARGDSASAVIIAQGEAQAIKLKQLTLTPVYVDYIRAMGWDGKYPTTMLGSSSTLFNIK